MNKRMAIGEVEYHHWNQGVYGPAMREERHPDMPTVTFKRGSTVTTGEALEEEKDEPALRSLEHETTGTAETRPQEKNNEAHVLEPTMDRHPGAHDGKGEESEELRVEKLTGRAGGDWSKEQ